MKEQMSLKNQLATEIKKYESGFKIAAHTCTPNGLTEAERIRLKDNGKKLLLPDNKAMTK